MQPKDPIQVLTKYAKHNFLIKTFLEGDIIPAIELVQKELNKVGITLVCVKTAELPEVNKE